MLSVKQGQDLLSNAPVRDPSDVILTATSARVTPKPSEQFSSTPTTHLIPVTDPTPSTSAAAEAPIVETVTPVVLPTEEQEPTETPKQAGKKR